VKDRFFLNKDFIKNFIKDFIKENRTQVSERQEKIPFMIADDETLTSQKIAQKTGVSQRTIQKDLTQLQTLGILARDGGRKDGTWVIVVT
jgi:ATP-dependent DNA helicase RecG